jgi:hypothetical protein
MGILLKTLVLRIRGISYQGEDDLRCIQGEAQTILSQAIGSAKPKEMRTEKL